MSRKLILYIAMSLDGYIADENGGVSWLESAAEPNGDGGYAAFLERIDTVILGRRTYEQIVTELSPGEWVYHGLQSFVLTHRPCADTDEITFTCEEAASLAKRLKAQPGKDIWVCGGADVARQFMERDLIDEYYLTVLPVLLGAGIRLFGDGTCQRLSLAESRVEGGMLMCRYLRKEMD